MKLYKLIPLLCVNNVTVTIKDLDDTVLETHTITSTNCDILDKSLLADLINIYGKYKVISLNFNTTTRALVIKINKKAIIIKINK